VFSQSLRSSIDGSWINRQQRKECEASLAECDMKIRELEHEIAQADKTAESGEKLRAEMD